MAANESGQVVLSPVARRWVHDQEASGEKSKKGAPRGHHGDDTYTTDSFHHRTKSWGYQDLTDVHLQKRAQ